MRSSRIVLIGLLFANITLAQPSNKWADGEHLELGDTGSNWACEEMGLTGDQCPTKNIKRKDRKVTFTYAEVLVSGDYYRAPNELFEDQQMGIKDALKCSYKLRHDHPTHNPAEGNYSGCTLSIITKMPGYLEVVSNNYEHFGWNSMRAYVQLHQRALEKAHESFMLKHSHPAESAAALTDALILNGFADHYLTDSFAGGHIRVPRIQIKNWAKENLRGLWKAARGDGLTMILHDSESISLKSGLEKGFLVENSRGDVWVTHGDQYLHTSNDSNDPGFMMPLTAIKESFKELLLTLETGLIPDGEFAATQYVPFSKEVSLVEKLTPKHQGLSEDEIIEALYGSLPFPQNVVLPKDDFKMMLRALPQIYTRFQQDIKHEISNLPELQHRLPQRYLEAFTQVN